LGRSRPPHLLGQFSGGRAGAHSSAENIVALKRRSRLARAVRNSDWFYRPPGILSGVTPLRNGVETAVEQQRGLRRPPERTGSGVGPLRTTVELVCSDVVAGALGPRDPIEIPGTWEIVAPMSMAGLDGWRWKSRAAASTKARVIRQVMTARGVDPVVDDASLCVLEHDTVSNRSSLASASEVDAIEVRVNLVVEGLGARSAIVDLDTAFVSPEQVVIGGVFASRREDDPRPTIAGAPIVKDLVAADDVVVRSLLRVVAVVNVDPPSGIAIDTAVPHNVLTGSRCTCRGRNLLSRYRGFRGL
jgi:hypothetical protein